ncbi:hypothetical protein NDU88_005674 [Pleurodeles waltl]|uniref:Uncharacterized protein n=1 Tax=Pleurodeles waltl TaxID=8319 RepID=A0AAV7UMG0_PLEWA|nr:hypothetical protein NDU88_005673 [Pleurodeles waltl]KAJ1188918.1 hypothetical protein NDU88_005674 [Pleurodeles waltl]
MLPASRPLRPSAIIHSLGTPPIVAHLLQHNDEQELLFAPFSAPLLVEGGCSFFVDGWPHFDTDFFISSGPDQELRN